MNYKGSVLFLLCALTAVSNQGVADPEDVGEEVEVGEEMQSASDNEGTPIEEGTPDSHEAMNNRDINLRSRDKRSYEFLMGLIKRNANYQITRMDSSGKPLRINGDDPNITATEILLELMINIAAHPDYWRKVHKLLENIDNDLITSKKIMDNFQNTKSKTELKTATKEPRTNSDEKQESGFTTNKSEKDLASNEWTTFQDQSGVNKKANFVNTVPPEDYRLENDQTKINYPKAFTYHRVTGRPMFLNKNPKAYIAVSVIAPKPMVARSNDEDFILEKELRQLKPWTHNQNLNNMAFLRSRWIIQRDEDRQKPIGP